VVARLHAGGVKNFGLSLFPSSVVPLPTFIVVTLVMNAPFSLAWSLAGSSASNLQVRPQFASIRTARAAQQAAAALQGHAAAALRGARVAAAQRSARRLDTHTHAARNTPRRGRLMRVQPSGGPRRSLPSALRARAHCQRTRQHGSLVHLEPLSFGAGSFYLAACPLPRRTPPAAPSPRTPPAATLPPRPSHHGPPATTAPAAPLPRPPLPRPPLPQHRSPRPPLPPRPLPSRQEAMSGGGESAKKQKQLLGQLTAMLMLLGAVAAFSKRMGVSELIAADKAGAPAGADSTAAPSADAQPSKSSPSKSTPSKPTPSKPRAAAKSPARPQARSPARAAKSPAKSPARATRRTVSTRR